MKLCLLVAFTLAFAASLALADNWPSWRGPTADGISTEKNLPTEWSETKNVAWKLPIPGMGGSSPIVWNDRIFFTYEVGKELFLICVSTDGKKIWDRKLGTGTRGTIKDPRKGGIEEGNEASSSPCVDGKHVYALVGSGDFACFDFDGNEVWKFNVQERWGKVVIQWGIHTSPLLDGDRIYLALLGTGAHWVIAIDKTTTKEIWRVDRPTEATGESAESYTTPFMWHNDKDKYLVVIGTDYATGHDLTDGKEIWRVSDLNPKGPKYLKTLRMIPTPVGNADMIVLATCKDGGSGPGGPVIGLKPDAKGIITKDSPAQLWRLPTGAPDVPSPLLADGYVYLMGDGGILVCLDAKDGKQMYKERVTDVRYRASPVFAGGKIYLTDRDGMVTIIKAGPQFEILARNELGDAITASPAISRGRIYLRGFRNLYAVEEKR